MRVMSPAYAVFWVNKIGLIAFLILPHMFVEPPIAPQGT
ncbi:hypothetical protein C8R32_103198 [Nitrosospira sp. Nsp5]|uniref:Uncharacterized protein n=1 Tax=Nitrosospira multiformis TaxID=1231 RepID=A0ABY0T7E5_9PROT|nr:hypothetical protein C8R32_103198 [Nitrosospira sp. Nsp5]SDQ26810.1 hypothetical protein SAMN05216402_0102 [Nitrosospira multiformis]